MSYYVSFLYRIVTKYLNVMQLKLVFIQQTHCNARKMRLNIGKYFDTTYAEGDIKASRVQTKQKHAFYVI